MRENIKKSLCFVLFLSFLCVSVFGLFFSTATAYAADEVVTISSATELRDYVSNYDKINVNDKIILGNDIDMGDMVLKGVIGTEEAPFAGTFDGRGYTIRNLSIDVSQTDAVNNAYAGLFGVTNGAKISNVALSGNMTLSTGNCVNSYAGALVARANNTNIKYCQITAKINYVTNLDNNINFGSLIGYAMDSDISYVICRSSQFGEWNFSSLNNKVMRFGGVIGTMDNSHLTFAVVGVGFDVNFSSNFAGDVSIGGVAGKVVQGGSSIYNVAMENSFSISNENTNLDSKIDIGQVVGNISVPAPESKNLAYIYYKQNSSVNRFGSMGEYQYTDADNYDFILPVTDAMTNSTYFENQKWHDFLGAWDFDSTWYFASSTIYLQSFYGNFIAIANDSDIIISKSQLDDYYRFGDCVEMEFSFKNSEDVDLSKFYNLSSVMLNSVEKAKIITTIENGKSVYRISSSDTMVLNNYKIQAVENGFKLVINSMNMYTSGYYTISTLAKSFKAQVTSALFDEKDVLQEGNIPGYVFYAEGTNTSTENLSLSKMTYGQTYRVETKGKPDLANSFVGWYLQNDEDDDILLGANSILAFTFGQGNITENCNIYAKYQNNARVVTFKLDDGVSRIGLDSGNIIIEENGQKVALSKDKPLIKLEIYTREGYDFDIEKLKTFLNTYTSSDSTAEFCEFVSSSKQENGENYYQFSLNMDYLGKDFANAFNVEVSTQEIVNQDNTWIWILVGTVSGALVIGLVIILIIVLKRRGGGGRLSGGGSFNKKSYKNMYY